MVCQNHDMSNQSRNPPAFRVKEHQMPTRSHQGRRRRGDDLLRRHGEARVDHAQRLAQPLLQEAVQRNPRQQLCKHSPVVHAVVFTRWLFTRARPHHPCEQRTASGSSRNGVCKRLCCELTQQPAQDVRRVGVPPRRPLVTNMTIKSN